MRFVLILNLLLCSGCASWSQQRDRVTELSGQPSWFPLGGEVYQEQERGAAALKTLSINPQSRWFLGYPQQVSQAEYYAWLKEHDVKMAQQPEMIQGHTTYQIPSSPAYPRTLDDLPLENQGAKLRLQVTASDSPKEMIWVLTLSADSRPVIREIEHRWTNILPFLFAFYADGKAIARPCTGFEKAGGVNQLVELVPAHGRQSWNLKVDMQSVAELVGPDTRELVIVAAFSERQHEGHFPENSVHSDPLTIWDMDRIKPQITIRSNTIRLRRSGPDWVTIDANVK